MRGAWESEPGTARPHDALPRRVERRDGRSGVKTNPASSIPLAGIVSDSIPFRKAASFRRPTASIEPSSRADAPGRASSADQAGRRPLALRSRGFRPHHPDPQDGVVGPHCLIFILTPPAPTATLAPCVVATSSTVTPFWFFIAAAPTPPAAVSPAPTAV